MFSSCPCSRRVKFSHIFFLIGPRLMFLFYHGYLNNSKCYSIVLISFSNPFNLLMLKINYNCRYKFLKQIIVCKRKIYENNFCISIFNTKIMATNWTSSMSSANWRHQYIVIYSSSNKNSLILNLFVFFASILAFLLRVVFVGSCALRSLNLIGKHLIYYW